MNEKLSKELEIEISAVKNFQKKLFSLSSESIESVFDFINESSIIKSQDTPTQLISSLFIAIEYRPWSIPYIARLCYKLLESASSTKSLSKLKFDILFTIFSKERLKQENLHFLAHCLDVKFLYPQDVVDFIHQTMIEKSDFVKEIIEYFAWFAPEIEMANPTLFEQLYSLYSKKPSTNKYKLASMKIKNGYFSLKKMKEHGLNNGGNEKGFEEEEDEMFYKCCMGDEDDNDFEPEFDEYFSNFEKLRENNWKLLKQYRLNLCNHHPINVAIKNDDADEVQRIINKEGIDINETSRPSIFELSLFCQTEPTLIQIAAFYGAVKCFKYFILNDADIQKCDEERKTTIQFAVAGGNYEIIRILQRANIDFSGAADISILYHRNEIFKWIYDTIESNVQSLGHLLQSSCGSNNLEVFQFCMEHGTDVNQKDENGVFFFFFFFKH